MARLTVNRNPPRESPSPRRFHLTDLQIPRPLAIEPASCVCVCFRATREPWTSRAGRRRRDPTSMLGLLSRGNSSVTLETDDNY